MCKKNVKKDMNKIQILNVKNKIIIFNYNKKRLMTIKYEKGLFIFRRDFRVIDNIGLNMANTICKHIYPVFIFTPEQVSNSNIFKSNNSIQFMIESLKDLSYAINKMTDNKLMCFYGNNNKIISYLSEQLNIDYVCFNADYTPYAIQRDLEIIKLCDKLNISVEYGHDYYLHPLGTIVNLSGNTYQKFTPFYNASIKKKVDLPTSLKKINFINSNKKLLYEISLNESLKKFTKVNNNILVHGGRNNAINQMKITIKNIKNYSKTRDELNKQTSHLSAYIKFGCISIREVYKTFKNKHDFIRQLFWRDFYAGILYSFPKVLGNALKPKYDKIKWYNNKKWFECWCKGETGFPIIDASMRQLNASGFMANRSRLIVMSFLIKTLLIDWKYGEKYFATKLTDYDPASNNGNIQWVMGGGSDSMPFFRIFNIWTQQEEHDKNCEYIKTWVPELISLNSHTIHNWSIEYVNNKVIKYPTPICDYSEQKDKCLKMYREALS